MKTDRELLTAALDAMEWGVQPEKTAQEIRARLAEPEE